MPIQVGFDPLVLEVVDVTEGSFLNQNNVQTAFDNNIDQDSGRVSINMSQPGQIGNSGRGSLVTITFKAIAVNPQSQITISSAGATDATGQVLPMRLPTPHNMMLLSP